MSNMALLVESLPKPVRMEFGRLEAAIAACDSRIQAMDGGEEGQQFAEQVASRLLRENARVLSLDVFDTVLLRNDACEARRYFDLSHNLSAALKKAGLGEIPAIDLYLTRCEAMEFGYRASVRVDGCVEGRIEDVLANQVKNLGLPKSAVKIFLKEEVAYECSALMPNPALIGIASRFAKNGGKVILVSDMYLSAKVIAAVIQKVAGKLSFIERLVSSADAIRNKRSGTIFPWLEKELDVPAEQFLHIGDSLISDFQRPIRAGWKAMHFPISDAEHRRRQQSLDQFLDEMEANGLNVSRWAKL